MCIIFHYFTVSKHKYVLRHYGGNQCLEDGINEGLCLTFMRKWMFPYIIVMYKHKSPQNLINMYFAQHHVQKETSNSHSAKLESPQPDSLIMNVTYSNPYQEIC